MTSGLLIAVSAVILSNTSPPGVPQGAAISTWPRFAGQVESSGARIAYELHVKPERAALYSLTRYRVLAPGGGWPGNEVLIWNARPGTREPLLCFERVAQRDWRTLWVVQRWSWEPMVHGTERYRSAMSAAIRVYYLHQATLEAAVP